MVELQASKVGFQINKKGHIDNRNLIRLILEVTDDHTLVLEVELEVEYKI